MKKPIQNVITSRMGRKRYCDDDRERRKSWLCRLCFFTASVCLTIALLLTVGGTDIFFEPSQMYRMPINSTNAMRRNGVTVDKLPHSDIPVHLATIFVSIASFRDVECVTTVRSLVSRAKRPLNVFLGISEERYDVDSSCLSEPETLAAIGVTRVRTLRWRDVVPSAFETENLFDGPRPTPLLHKNRDNDVITCMLNAATPGINPLTGTSVLHGCQVVMRSGDPDDARGPTYGRYLSSLFYNNQDYYMVIDSHSRLIPDWDEKMIRHARLMPTRGVLSHYPNGYVPDKPDEEFGKDTVMSMCKGVILPNNIPKLGARWMRLRHFPVLQGFVAAGYIFGDAQFVKDVPFDPYLPYLFDGEEILYTVRLWTSGWDSYTPGAPFLLHNYGRVKAPRFWSVVYGDSKSVSRVFEHRTAIRRALYLLRRRELNTSRLLVTDEEAHKMNPAIGRHASHFGMGKFRPLKDYWHFVELSEEFLKAKDSEGRWMGGSGLCPPE